MRWDACWNNQGNSMGRSNDSSAVSGMLDDVFIEKRSVERSMGWSVERSWKWSVECNRMINDSQCSHFWYCGVGSHCSMITYAFCVMLHDGPHALNCNGFTVFTIWYDAHAGCCLFAAIESHFSAMHQCDNFMLDWGTVGRVHALV